MFFVPEFQVFVLLAVHLPVGAGSLVALAAEVQHAVDDYPAHFAEPRGAVSAGTVSTSMKMSPETMRVPRRSL